MTSTFESIKKLNKIHFIGIGGSGMYGIAEVLLNLGCLISGSDTSKTTITKRLKSLGVIVFSKHHPSNLKKVDLVVYSNAINKNNPELKYAINKKITTIPRAEMLSELMRFKYGVAVAGSHGKSTTTSLISWLLSENKLDPTYIVGGKLKTSNNHGRLGNGKYLIAEADESDRSFLFLKPQICAITNIDKEHLENYSNKLIKLKKAYVTFANNIPFYGKVFLNGDDKNIKSIIKEITRPICTFGIKKTNDFYAKDIEITNKGMIFKIIHSQKNFKVKTKLYGIHNVLNILSAFAISLHLGLSNKKIIKGIESFEGVTRRFDVYNSFKSKLGNHLMINDYGHHPTEIEHTIKTIRKIWKGKKIIMVFQPHRFSRTENCLSDFIRILSKVDNLILTETYSGGEKKSKFTSYYLYKKMLPHIINCSYVKNINLIPKKLFNIFKKDNILLVQGAGNISQLIKLL